MIADLQWNSRLMFTHSHSLDASNFNTLRLCSEHNDSPEDRIAWWRSLANLCVENMRTVEFDDGEENEFLIEARWAVCKNAEMWNGRMKNCANKFVFAAWELRMLESRSSSFVSWRMMMLDDGVWLPFVVADSLVPCGEGKLRLSGS